MKKGCTCYEEKPDFNRNTGIADSKYCVDFYYDVQCNEY